MMNVPSPRIALVNALYPTIEAGLAADLHVASALECTAHPVCTSIISASSSGVTDITEVPADTVQAQLDRLDTEAPPDAVRIGVLGTHQTVEVVTGYLDRFRGPSVLDLVVEGEAGSTVLTRRGVEILRERLGVVDLVLLTRTDAELISGGEITSLDDAQVAAQRLHRLGARRVLIKCGSLPHRHFELEASDEAMKSDLYYDGQDFGLFEAPEAEAPGVRGASSALAVTVLHGLLDGRSMEQAIQAAKRYVTEALRHARRGRLGYDWSQKPTGLMPN